MDQAESLRSLFSHKMARDNLIDCRNKLYQAIKTGNHADIECLMAELEQAQRSFEALLKRQ
ncbi:hypothetical protein RJ45_18900 [Photobacterium gaetbulicola]|uniref:Uncharacterized protein n=1 Tax=Photobacterium gaetbulicola TaxID=1295392 RepID=A0A0B9G0S3_9GAMM|nr:hypothetical protein [Photobacterium gaetbulicola]KHT62224.1 hypothetical protein RJ45_18900 [Photobacterium gaetbulicola]